MSYETIALATFIFLTLEVSKLDADKKRDGKQGFGFWQSTSIMLGVFVGAFMWPVVVAAVAHHIVNKK